MSNSNQNRKANPQNELTTQIQYRLIEEISARKRVEEEIRQKTEDLSLVNSLNHAVNQGDSFQEIVDLLSVEIKKIFSCKGATIYLLSADKKHLILQTCEILSTSVKSRVEKIIGMKIPGEIKISLKAGSLYRKTLQAGKSQLINDPETIQRLMTEFTENKVLKRLVPSIYRVIDIKSVINIPFLSKGEVIGLMDISSSKTLTESDLHRLEIISEHLTLILKRKQAEAELERKMRTLERLNKYMVDRELKMVELKKEINALYKKAGESVKYPTLEYQ